jgi:hypothetical protein
MRLIRVLVVALSGLFTLLSCSSDETTAPETVLSHTVTSAHYMFHMAPGDLVDTTWQERYYAWVIVQLQVQPNERLQYFKYRNRAHITQVTGRATNGFAEPGTLRFHTIWPVDNHEGVHTLVIQYIGHPTALFNEGVAVAHHMDPLRGDLTPRWSGTPIHMIARQAEEAHRIPALSSLLTSQGFFEFDSQVMYPVAGSFVRYLIDTYGLQRFKALLTGAMFTDAPSTTQSRFLAAYGKSLQATWDEWRAWLIQQP